MEWKAVAALWGAGLSTWLALHAWLRNRPLITLEPTGSGQSADAHWLLVRIKNTSGQPLCVRDFHIWTPKTIRVTIKTQRRHWDPQELNRPRNLVLYPDQTVYLQLDLSTRADGTTEDRQAPLRALLRWDFMATSWNLPRYVLLRRSRAWIEDLRSLDHFDAQNA